MHQSLTQFLQEHGYPSAQGLSFIGAGMFSQAYQFDTDAGKFVLRTGHTREAFEKDKLAYERLGHVVPIPVVQTIGMYDANSFYCISNWLPGQLLTEFDKAGTEQLLPALFEVLVAISRVPVGADLQGVPIGFGILDGQGKPRRPYTNWADFITAIDDFPQTFTPRGNEVYKPWNELYTTSFLTKSLVEDAYERLCKLAPLLPNERHYVHGDFGYENALATGSQVTAILDWAELRCGDWLYDLAYVAYYTTMNLDYVAAFCHWIAQRGIVVENLQERIQAYYLHIFLGNIFLEANRNQRDWYDEDVERYQQLRQKAGW